MTAPARRRRSVGARTPAMLTPEPVGQGPSFVLSCVDLPRPGARLLPGSLLSGKGWAVSSSPIASITVHLGEQFLCYASYGQPRPEIGRDFGHYPQAHHAGFVFAIELGADIAAARGADLEFRFRTEDGSESHRHLPLSWPDPGAESAQVAQDAVAARPWPIRLALEECRVDRAGRLRLRGWAAARAELTTLQLFLNDTPLHAPERGLPRPDIGERHPGYAQAATSGFRLMQMLDAPSRGRDTVRVVARAGAIQRQIIVPLAASESQLRVVQDGAVTLCCEILRLNAEGTLIVTGWSVGEAETREIELLAGSVSLGLAELGLPRPDIGNRFPSLPAARFAGFRFRQPSALAPGDTLLLVVRDAAGVERQMTLQVPGLPSHGDPASDAAPDEEVIYAGIDTPILHGGHAAEPVTGRLTIAGWAVCASGIAAIELWSDDVRLGEAYLGVRREDIAATHPELAGALTSGFALGVPHRRIGDGEHLIRVLIRARSGMCTETLFRVLLRPDDTGRIGSARRTVPFRETALRLDLLKRFGTLPVCTVLIRGTAAREQRGLAVTLDSLRRQTLPGWRALVVTKDAEARDAALATIAADLELAARTRVHHAGTGLALWEHAVSGGAFELLSLIRPGDRLGADALMELALEARLAGADFVYGDERCFDPGREGIRPWFKPGWSPELLLSMNYVGRTWCATRGLVDRALGGPRMIERIGDYDAVLRLTEHARCIAHVPLALGERAGRRVEPAAVEAEALTRAAKRRGIDAALSPGRAAGTWRLRRSLPSQLRVSVIIATAGARGLIRRTLETLRAHSAGISLEIIVLDGIPAADAVLKAWVCAQADSVLAAEGPFNWSRLCNLGAGAATAEFLLFLNDDVECREPDWLLAMLEHAQRPEIGAVGAQLLYPDGKVQHAGMTLRGGEGVHAFRFAEADDPGPFGLALTPREVIAVTGACLLTRRAVFDALGGFDETHGVIKNDLDFCLRAGAAGWRVIYTPYASLLHHEMASRAALPDSFDAARFDAAWGHRQRAGDPWLNPQLAVDSDDYAPEFEPVQVIQPGAPLFDHGQVRRILVIKLDHIGDFIVAITAIERLRAGFPGAEITLLASAAVLELARLCPAIDRVVRFDFFAAEAAAGRRAIGEAEFDTLAGLLRPRHFDLAVDLRVHADTRHVLRYTGAAVLAGFDHGGRFPWLHIAVEWEGDVRLLDKRTHIADSLNRLAGAIADAGRPAGPVLLAPPAACASALLQAAGASAQFAERPFVCIHAGAGSPLKQWPPACFAALILLLLEAHDLSVVLVGGGADSQIAAEIAAAVARPDAVLPLAGRVKLADLPALVAGCVLFVGNDSGPKHLAGALGVPTVGVHASHVDAAEWAPLGPRALAVRRHMSCGPCYIADEADCPRGVACLRGISPAQVYRACRLLLGFAFPTAFIASDAASPRPLPVAAAGGLDGVG